MSIPRHLDSDTAKAAASIMAEARVVNEISDDAIAAVFGWPVWLVTLLIDLVLEAEAEG